MVAGTTRSTIVLGKRALRSSHSSVRAPPFMRRAEVVHEPAQHDAVARQVVAREERQRPRLAALRAQRDAARELPDRGARRAAREVGGDLEVVEPQPAGGAVARVGLLGHGQRDHVDARVGDRLAQAVGLARGEQHVADRRDDRDRVLLRPALEHAEQPVLRAERVDRRRPPLRDAEDAPVAARALDRLGGVDGLVGAVERADAEVDDADGGPLGERRARRAAEAAQGRWLEAWQPAGRHEAVTVALCRPSALGVTHAC